METADKYPGVEFTANRLFQNQVELGNNLAKFYGKRIGEKYAVLLHDHIQIAAEIVGAAIVKKDITKLNAEWAENGNEIARLLYQVNPNFINLKVIEKSFADHLSTTLDEATAIIGNNYQASIEKGEIAKKHIESMSAYIERAIIRQFLG